MKALNEQASRYQEAKKKFDKLIADGCISPKKALMFIEAGIKSAGQPNKEFAKMFAGKWAPPVAAASESTEELEPPKKKSKSTKKKTKKKSKKKSKSTKKKSK